MDHQKLYEYAKKRVSALNTLLESSEYGYLFLSDVTKCIELRGTHHDLALVSHKFIVKVLFAKLIVEKIVVDGDYLVVNDEKYDVNGDINIYGDHCQIIENLPCTHYIHTNKARYTIDNTQRIMLITPSCECYKVLPSRTDMEERFEILNGEPQTGKLNRGYIIAPSDFISSMSSFGQVCICIGPNVYSFDEPYMFSKNDHATIFYDLCHDRYIFTIPNSDKIYELHKMYAELKVDIYGEVKQITTRLEPGQSMVIDDDVITNITNDICVAIYQSKGGANYVLTPSGYHQIASSPRPPVDASEMPIIHFYERIKK